VGLGVDASKANLGLARDAFRPKVPGPTWGWAWTHPEPTWGWAWTRPGPTKGWPHSQCNQTVQSTVKALIVLSESTHRAATVQSTVKAPTVHSSLRHSEQTVQSTVKALTGQLQCRTVQCSAIHSESTHSAQ